jgi:hypothetical protein
LSSPRGKAASSLDGTLVASCAARARHRRGPPGNGSRSESVRELGTQEWRLFITVEKIQKISEMSKVAPAEIEEYQSRFLA